MIKRTHGYILIANGVEVQMSVYGRGSGVRLDIRKLSEGNTDVHHKWVSRSQAGQILKRAHQQGAIHARHYFRGVIKR